MQTTLQIAAWPPDTSLSQELPLDICISFDEGHGFVLPICSIWFWTAVLICLWERPIHHILPIVNLQESLDPGPCRWSTTSFILTYQLWLWYMRCFRPDCTAAWKPCHFTLHQWQSYKGLRSYFSETWLKYLQTLHTDEWPGCALNVFCYLILCQ